MELYLGYLNLLLAWVSQFRLKLLKAGAVRVSVLEPEGLKPGCAYDIKGRAMPTVCKEAYRPPALQQTWAG